jgi:hypothetical protein
MTPFLSPLPLTLKNRVTKYGRYCVFYGKDFKMVSKFFFATLFSLLLGHVSCLAMNDGESKSESRHPLRERPTIEVYTKHVVVNHVEESTFFRLNSIVASDSSIEQISLENCNLGEESIPSLRKTLTLFQGKGVDLRRNNLCGKHMARTLDAILIENTSLRLYLESNKFGLLETEILKNHMRADFPIDLSGQSLTIEDINSLQRIFDVSKPFPRTLILNNCTLKDGLKDSLKDALCKFRGNLSLEGLVLEGLDSQEKTTELRDFARSLKSKTISVAY